MKPTSTALLTVTARGRLLLVASAFVAAPVLSGAQGVTVFIAGEGNVACGTYLQDRRANTEPQAYIYATWVRGFLSGFNYATPGRPMPSIPQTDTVLAYLDKYCRDNPLQTLSTGAAYLAADLGGRKK